MTETSEDLTREGTPRGFVLFGINWTSENVLMACIPVVIYFATYCGMTGYYGTYGIPPELVDVNLFTVFSITVIVVTGYFFATGFWNDFILPTLKYLDANIHLLYTYLFGISAALSLVHWALGVGALFGFLFIFWYDIKQAYLSKKSLKGMGKRLRYRKEALDVEKAKLALTEKVLRDRIGAVVGCAVAIWWFSSSLGVLAAHLRTNYLILPADPRVLVMFLKDGKAICSEYDPATRTVSGRLVVTPLSDAEKTIFEKRELGWLHFK